MNWLPVKTLSKQNVSVIICHVRCTVTGCWTANITLPSLQRKRA
uniref:Uncharacterized protein n=1 Tax=Anguilla anguilla TaxID=7936 RepID=A0A0E9PWM2_ANGAN